MLYSEQAGMLTLGYLVFFTCSPLKHTHTYTYKETYKHTPETLAQTWVIFLFFHGVKSARMWSETQSPNSSGRNNGYSIWPGTQADAN